MDVGEPSKEVTSQDTAKQDLNAKQALEISSENKKQVDPAAMSETTPLLESKMWL